MRELQVKDHKSLSASLLPVLLGVKALCEHFFPHMVSNLAGFRCRCLTQIRPFCLSFHSPCNDSFGVTEIVAISM